MEKDGCKGRLESVTILFGQGNLIFIKQCRSKGNISRGHASAGGMSR